MKLLQTMYCIAKINGDVVLESGKKKDGSSFEYVSCPIEAQVGRFAPKRKMKYRAFREDDSYMFDMLDGVAPASTKEENGKTIKIYTAKELEAVDPDLMSLHTGKDFDGMTFRIRICEYDLEGKYHLMRAGKPVFDETNRRKHACFWTTTTRAFAFTREIESLNNLFHAEWVSNIPESRIIANVLSRDLEPERKPVSATGVDDNKTVDDMMA